jgi:predicted ATP-dependent serine protease
MNFERFEQDFAAISEPCMDCKRINPFVTGGCQGCGTWNKIISLVMKNHIERQAEKMSACSKQ